MLSRNQVQEPHPQPPPRKRGGGYDLTFHVMWKTPLPFVSPARREALNFPPSLVGKGVRGLGFTLAFSDPVKSQGYDIPYMIRKGYIIYVYFTERIA